MSGKSTRDDIVNAADQLFYRHGYRATSFSDIAGAVQISRGNFYHHFKTKDEILDEVIGTRMERTRRMLARWEAASDDPEERIRSFIRILLVNRVKIERHGCPVGTLCTELAKLGHDARADANELFTLFRDWLRQQFVLLGRPDDADVLAMHVLARSQGVATLTHAFPDEAFVRYEVDRMCEWLAACAREGAAHE